jgi:hypothetical protein
MFKWARIFIFSFFLLVQNSVFAQYINQTLYYSHGTYVGETYNGRAHGRGTYTAARSGTVYTGQFSGDTFYGNGTMFWTNGSKFVGYWQNDSAISGRIIYPNGSTQEGTVRNAVFYPSQTQYSAPPPVPSRPAPPQISPERAEKNRLDGICPIYYLARQTCASAPDYGRCMRIRMSNSYSSYDDNTCFSR